MLEGGKQVIGSQREVSRQTKDHRTGLPIQARQSSGGSASYRGGGRSRKANSADELLVVSGMLLVVSG